MIRRYSQPMRFPDRTIPFESAKKASRQFSAPYIGSNPYSSACPGIRSMPKSQTISVMPSPTSCGWRFGGRIVSHDAWVIARSTAEENQQQRAQRALYPTGWFHLGEDLRPPLTANTAISHTDAGILRPRQSKAGVMLTTTGSFAGWGPSHQSAPIRSTTICRTIV